MHLLIIKVMLMISVVLYYRLPRTFGATRTRLITSNKKDIKQPSKDAVTDDKSTFCSFVIEPGDDCRQASSEPQMITFSCRDSISLPLQSCDKEICISKGHRQQKKIWRGGYAQ